jgi:hypothetical protein
VICQKITPNDLSLFTNKHISSQNTNPNEKAGTVKKHWLNVWCMALCLWHKKCYVGQLPYYNTYKLEKKFLKVKWAISMRKTGQKFEIAHSRLRLMFLTIFRTSLTLMSVDLRSSRNSTPRAAVLLLNLWPVKTMRKWRCIWPSRPCKRS